jgi:glycosyltransferase involved in cell wall biosynthesis
VKVYYSSAAFLLQRYGGISRYYNEIHQQLRTLGISSYVGGLFHASTHSFCTEHRFPLRKISVTHLPARTYWFFRLINSIYDLIALNLLRPDIYHLTYYDQVPCLLPRSTLIVTSSYDATAEKLYSSCSQTPDLVALRRKAYTTSNHIIAISHSTKDDIVRLYHLHPHKVSVVYLSAFSTPQKSVIPLLTPKRSFLLYVGSRAKYKNFDILLSTYLSSPDLHQTLDLVVFGDSRTSNSESQLLNEHPYAALHVHFISGDDSVLHSLYQASFALVYPSLNEGFGLPVLEAQQYTPVLLSDIPVFREIAETSSIYFDPTSTTSLHSAIKTLLDSNEIYAHYLAQSAKNVRRFSWSQSAQQTIQIYSKCLSSNHEL